MKVGIDQFLSSGVGGASLISRVCRSLKRCLRYKDSCTVGMRQLVVEEDYKERI